MENRNVIPPSAAFTISAENASPSRMPNFSFLLNVGRLIGSDSFLLAPGHELRRATADEMSWIQDQIRTLASNSQYMIVPWEQSIDPSGQWGLLPEEHWRYFVISFEGTNQTVEDLSEAFTLTTLEPRIAFTMINWKGAIPALVMNPQRLFIQLEAARWGKLDFLDLGESDVQEIREIRTQLQSHSHTSIDIHRYTRELQQLEALPTSSPLLFLGYFGLLESVLTHQPDAKDPLDSITRQVKNKLALLQQRFRKPLDYSAFSGSCGDRVWAKMYDYRSRLAHGDVPDFKGKLAMLRGHQDALALLRQAVKAVLRQTLIEPQLVSDLRNC